MSSLFSVDGPVMSKVTKIADCIFASVLWFIFSLPVLTIGASSAALYETVYKYIRNDRGTLWQTFRNAFRENLKRSAVIWIITLFIEFFIAADALIFRSTGYVKLYYAMLVLFLIAATWSVYTTAYSARFDGRVRDVISLSFLLMIMHPFRALGVLAMVVCAILLVIAAPVTLLILPAVFCFACSFILEKIFLLHMSEEDKEKIEKEELK